MRTLGVDYGTKRLGLALSDEGGRFASPLGVLTVANPEHAARLVLDAIRRQGVRRLVIGLPLNTDGTTGPAARAVLHWGDMLSRHAAEAGQPVALAYVDERLSSFVAEQTLAARRRGGEKLTRGDKKRRLDALAAAGILQDYLDGTSGTFPAEPPDVRRESGGA